MPDLNDRDGWENKLADGVESELQRFARQLGKLIPTLAAVSTQIPLEHWDTHTEKLLAATAPVLHDIFLARSNELIDALGFTSVDWGLVDTAASGWARDYGYNLVTGINATTQDKLRNLIPQYFEQQWTQGQLTEQLMNVHGAFGRTRSEMIARTEVTRAASEGTQQTQRELAQQGITMQPIWRTREDEIVCPICGPRADLPIVAGNATMGEHPPAHPRCRCWETLELVSD